MSVVRRSCVAVMEERISGWEGRHGGERRRIRGEVVVVVAAEDGGGFWSSSGREEVVVSGRVGMFAEVKGEEK